MSDENVLTKEIAKKFLADEYSVSLGEFMALSDKAAESGNTAPLWACLSRSRSSLHS